MPADRREIWKVIFTVDTLLTLRYLIQKMRPDLAAYLPFSLPLTRMGSRC